MERWDTHQTLHKGRADADHKHPRHSWLCVGRHGTDTHRKDTMKV